MLNSWMGSVGDQIVPTGKNQMEVAGHVANRHASANVFSDFNKRKAANTLTAYRRGLEIFAQFLAEAGIQGVDADCLMMDPDCWQGVTWGIVQAYLSWLLDRGYAMATVNHRLAIVKKYARLAAKAGVMKPDDEMRIRFVTGYGGKEAARIDAERPVTRVGAKKSKHISISPAQAKRLKQHDLRTSQGRRDALLMSIMIDHGLRVGEVASLQVGGFKLEAGEFKFYRAKVDKWQTHRLTADSLRAAVAYFEHDAPAKGRLILGSRKGGKLTDKPMTERAMTKRVRYLGHKMIGVGGMSAHDLRHYWATDAVRNGTDIYALRDAGGWASLAMPNLYVEEQRIANERVKLSS